MWLSSPLTAENLALGTLNTVEHQLPRRRTLRLSDYDYSNAGAYFITVCVACRRCLLGDLRDGTVCLSPAGECVRAAWTGLESRYTGVLLGEYVIMPNHVHGILLLGSETDLGGHPSGSKSLGQIVGAFKTRSAHLINDLRLSPGISVWQRGYYEHVVRNERSLRGIREYIANNPSQWALDCENPDRQ